MAQGDPKKFQMPGWKIEQHYSPGVLIGNWAEERYKVSFLYIYINLRATVSTK